LERAGRDFLRPEEVYWIQDSIVLTYDIYRIAQAKGIELGGTEEQYDVSTQHAARLKPRVRS
jgi:hypothetical protein